MKKTISPKIVYTVGAFGGFLFGYDIGIINGALPSLKTDWPISSLMEGMITSFLFVGAILGASLMGSLADKFGRRKMIMLSAIVFAIGAIGSGISSNEVILIIARIVLGFAVGGASALVPMYLGEISPTEVRGRISGLNQLMITIGILVAYGVNYAFITVDHGWRWMLGGAAIPAILLLLGALILPESPRYLMSRGRHNEALEALKVLRPEIEAQAEFDGMLTDEAPQKASFAVLSERPILLSVLIGCGITFLQQIQGANTIFYYSSQIFGKIFGSGLGGIISTVGIGVVMVLATIVTLMVVDRYNRRTMMMAGSVGMGISLILSGSFFHAAEQNHTWAVWAVFGFISLYVVCYSFSWAALTWIVVGEMFPSKVRGLATGLASAVNWFGNIVVALFFPMMLEKFDLSVIFDMFALMCGLGFLFAKFVMYETKGKTLEEIESQVETLGTKASIPVTKAN